MRALAAAQTKPVRCGFAENLEQHLDLVAIASAEGAETVVFPELSLTGYELDLARDQAFSEDDPRLCPLLESADATSTTLIVGAPFRTDDLLHIAAFVLSPRRSVEIYTKRHLGAFPRRTVPDGSVPPAEATVFEPGDREPVVQLGDSIRGVGICADTSRPSYVERAARRGARSYFASMFVVPSDVEEDTSRLRGYAELHSMPVVFSNYGGPSGGLPAGGESAVWSETGDLVARLNGSGMGVAVGVEEADGWNGSAIMLGD